MAAGTRTILRNRRFQFIGTLSLVLAAGMAVVTYIVITSPARNADHPGGFSPGFRVLAAAACILAATTFAVYGVGAMRVALIIDQNRLVIRNPLRTTKIDWSSRPRFDVRDRKQDVVVYSPGVDGTPPRSGTMTYRYHEIVCTAGRRHIWIAATSRMTHRDRVDQLLGELRAAGFASHH
jgi:hypothetical protein